LFIKLNCVCVQNSPDDSTSFHSFWCSSILVIQTCLKTVTGCRLPISGLNNIMHTSVAYWLLYTAGQNPLYCSWLVTPVKLVDTLWMTEVCGTTKIDWWMTIKVLHCLLWVLCICPNMLWISVCILIQFAHHTSCILPSHYYRRKKCDFYCSSLS
jgi:hypothetical protein